VCDRSPAATAEAEHLPATVGCLDVADANLQMPFAVLAAADEGRINGDGDGRRCGRRLDRRGLAEVLADFERMAAQSLGELPPISLDTNLSSRRQIW
jgi:hypothetical protein